ncbi:MAG: preprotein translocase subunit SecG [Candidatus Kerfeldbacteria bacterium]|nr:preprotein translocase subunit SecG [Candidatus Kerfeldbacteria bacterium]
MPAWIKQFAPIAQLVLSIFLIGLILIQSKGSGLSGVFGGEGNVYRTKRGAEKVIFIGTVAIAVLFFGVAILNAYR